MRAGALAAALLAGGALLLPSLETDIREWATDQLMHLAPRQSGTATPVLAVAVTEADLDQFGPWPWPRQQLAGLVERLAGSGAAAITLDIGTRRPGAR